MADTGLLNETERDALAAALDDEYKSHTTYQQVINDFGPVRPFINIVEAEARHISALLALADRYGIAPRENPWDGRTPRFGSIQDACVAGVQAEIENVALYDRLIQSTQRPDILTVFQSLRSASQDRHLPAFRRCSERGARAGE
jgi:hypothetical protein